MNETPKRGPGKPSQGKPRAQSQPRQRPGRQAQGCAQGQGRAQGAKRAGEQGQGPRREGQRQSAAERQAGASRAGQRRPTDRRPDRQGTGRGPAAVDRRAGSQDRAGQRRAEQRPTQQKRQPVQARPAKRPTAREIERTRFRRRILALLIVGILAVGSLVFVVRYALAKIETHVTPVNPVAKFEPVACTASALTTTADLSGNSVGDTVVVSASITNSGDTPCYFDAAELRLQLTSGNQTVYDSQVCQMNLASKLLLLDTGMTTVQALAWNGINAGQDCSGGNVAGGGTYVARLFLGADPLLESGRIFEMYDSGVPAKPEPTQEGTPAEESE